MEGILLVFLTGLTTGGLSCMAVQGGLLASSLAYQLEKDILTVPQINPSRRYRNAKKSSSKRVPSSPQSKHHPQIALPILLFLAAKIIAYTIIGFVLGMLGSVFELNATTRAFLLLAIGLFMIGNALRMLNVHPIFRYFSLEPPTILTRYINRVSKNNVSLFTPLFPGHLQCSFLVVSPNR